MTCEEVGREATEATSQALGTLLFNGFWAQQGMRGLQTEGGATGVLPAREFSKGDFLTTCRVRFLGSTPDQQDQNL